MKLDEKVKERKKQLVADALMIIDKIKKLDKHGKYQDPLISSAIISKAVKAGVLDAPHLCGVKAAKGSVRTMFVDGKNLTVDKNFRPISEKERLGKIREDY